MCIIAGTIPDPDFCLLAPERESAAPRAASLSEAGLHLPGRPCRACGTGHRGPGRHGPADLCGPGLSAPALLLAGGYRLWFRQPPALRLAGKGPARPGPRAA